MALNIAGLRCENRRPTAWLNDSTARIKEVVQQTSFDPARQFEETLIRYLQIYNFNIPLRNIGHATPMEAVNKGRKTHPELFKESKCNHPGLDSTALTIEDMPRIFGYAPEGVRCFGKHDVMSKLLTTALFDGTVIEAWLQQGLLPVLPNGAVVVMDNASFHKSEKIQEAVEAAGCLLEYLPLYSSDLNPIEHKWAQAKALKTSCISAVMLIGLQDCSRQQ